MLVIALLFPYMMTILHEGAIQLAMAAEIPVKGVCTANELNIRIGPGTEYELVKVNGERAYLVKEQEVEILGEENGWYKLSATIAGQKVTGYSLGTYITVTQTAEPTPIMVESTSYHLAAAAEVTANELNFRTEPDSSKDNVIKTLKQGDAVTVIGQKTVDGRKWYRLSVNVDGSVKKGYSVSEYICCTFDREIYGKATAKTNLYETAGSTQKVKNSSGKEVTVAKAGIMIADAESTVEGVKWFHVSTEVSGKAYTGYVSADKFTLLGDKETVLVTATPTPQGENAPTKEVTATPTPIAATKVPESDVQGAQAVITANELNLRKQATTSSEVIFTMVKDQKVVVFGMVKKDDRTWYLMSVEHKGTVRMGYAVADYVKLLTPLPTATPTPTPSPTPSPTPTATPTPTSTPTPTPSPTPSPSPIPAYTVLDRGVIEGAEVIALKEEPKRNSKLTKTESGYPVVVEKDLEFDILGYEQEGENVWCQIHFDQMGETFFGYIHTNYLKVLEKSEVSGDPEPTSTPTPVEEMDFEAMLEAQNFPESYKEGLRAIHAEHPTWQFIADHTGLDWNFAVDSENVVGENLIPNSKGIAWKSLEPNAYNWKTDTFIPYDGSSWVTASREALSYYMDPRNFLDSTNIFQFELLTYEPSYQTLEGVERIISNTALANTLTGHVNENGENDSMTYAEIFMSAAAYSGVSPFHLASRVKQEVVIGTSSLSNSVTGKVAGFEGLYNFFNIGAYHSTVAGGAIANGLKYARNGSTNAALNEKMMIPWSDPYRSIHGGAYYIGYSYIGRGQNTIYLQKFNMTPTSTFHHQYMANVEAPYSEGRRVANAYKEFGELPLVFSIPVFLNMPEEPCPMPGTAYNPNNWLKSLDVYDADGKRLELTPKFDMSAEQEYYLVVDSNCSIVKLKAQAVSTKACVEGVGTFKLNDGITALTVSVTAENGDVREYHITVAKSES